ncbi:hypothetical protein BGP77_00630 [Saccharospirillum sp. MSK14-1]|uniref:DUF6482 family protein n=1 Tax=Saccharospirillum sp. MSK14-1 TaxID=1897632 RepID=UPI000D3DB3DE|nr:DUF6482 family protein [Saccharospirillum sp. MSK14-1]PTY35867.1 hypothetical protein BGP77_00630 [Saccharospirillum sp. MSK14-1]
MMLTLKQARQTRTPFTRAEVAALQASFYHLHLFQGDQGQLLVNENGQPLVLKSLPAVRQLLAQLPIESAELVHRSAFGEMIGQADGDNTLRVPLTIHAQPQGEFE